MKLKALNKWERSWWHLHLNLAQQHRRPLNCLVWLEFHSILHLDGTVLLCSPKGARKQRSETPFTCEQSYDWQRATEDSTLQIDPYIGKKTIIHWWLDELPLMINKASFFSFPACLRNQTQKKRIFERTAGIASNWLWLRSNHRSVYWAMPV